MQPKVCGLPAGMEIMMNVLQVNHLMKRFGKFQALHNINLSVREGEILGFIGPNGAGKTTTIRILLGILKASSGAAAIFGKDVWKDAVEIHKRIAYVPGDVSLWSNLTGGEVIDLFVKLRGNHNRNRRQELLEQFELDPSKKCRTYSKGNRQKVALVAALAAEADFYILDEPTSGFDPLMERMFQECVFKLKDEGKSILLSSHILSEVEKLCDRVSIVRQGNIIETGTLSELRHLTRVQVAVETKNRMDTLYTIHGVHDIRQEGQTYYFQADSHEIGAIISYISGYGILKLESSPPALEELFISHYENGEG